MSIYNNALKHIENTLHDHGVTYMNQLNNLGHKLFGVKFAGVFPSDKIPKLNDIVSMAIINLDNSHEPGSHWIGLYKKLNDLYMYDSFDRSHHKILPNLQGNHIIDIKSGNKTEQKIKEDNCGQRSMTYLYLINKYGIENISSLLK